MTQPIISAESLPSIQELIVCNVNDLWITRDYYNSTFVTFTIGSYCDGIHKRITNLYADIITLHADKCNDFLLSTLIKPHCILAFITRVIKES